VLAVSVRRDDARDVRELQEMMVEACLESATLAEIDGVAQECDGRNAACFTKDGSAFHAASVIDDEDRTETSRDELLDQRGKAMVGLPGRNEDSKFTQLRGVEVEARWQIAGGHLPTSLTHKKTAWCCESFIWHPPWTRSSPIHR
jgi:hypothetical protein